jgi:hypothetical protein
MKNKIILTLILISSLAYNASAYKIIIAGGGPNRLYNYIEIDEKHCTCRGNGHNPCPVNFGSMQGQTMSTWVPMDKITDYVYSQVKEGNTSGETIFEDDLPVKWNVTDKETIEIEIDNTNVKGLEKYYDEK